MTARPQGVLVTRPLPEADATAAKLAALGFSAVISPVTRALELAATPERRRFDAILLVSARAARAAARLGLQADHVFAVGDRTAREAAALGFANVVSAGGAREDLLRVVRQTIVPGAALVLPLGRDHHCDLPEALRAAGYRLEAPVVYDMVASPALSDDAIDALRSGTIVAILHYSPRHARIVRSLCEQAGVWSLAETASHVCLSSAVAEALGRPGAMVAGEPNEAALLAALTAALRHTG